MVAPDVFGYTLPNTRLLADKFAESCSAICVVPDTFLGSEPPATLMDHLELVMGQAKVGFFKYMYSLFTLIYWLPGFLIRNPNTPTGRSFRRIETVIRHYRTSGGISKVGVSGYCYGGKQAVLLAQRNDLVDVIAANHPGGLKIPQDILPISKPAAFILTPDKDMELKHKEMDLISKTLAEKGERYEHIVKGYADMQHGFAVRGGNKDPVVVSNRENAFQVVSDFFRKVLSLA